MTEKSKEKEIKCNKKGKEIQKLKISDKEYSYT